ncbi:MAG: hypothetical protein HC828_19530, partial [Blastochloris sp.]|nr:hypothetical protein [Blastochloris sp.]
ANLPRNEDERLEVIHFMMFTASIVSITGLLQAANFSPMMQILGTFYPSVHTSTAADAGRVDVDFERLELARQLPDDQHRGHPQHGGAEARVHLPA